MKLYKNVKNIFIIDWDDTLFPTFYFMEHRKNKTMYEIKKDEQFIELDIQINSLLKSMHMYGSIYIVTNATYKWIIECLSILPKTNKFIIEHGVNIISARNEYSDATPNINLWKIMSFQEIMQKYVNDDCILNVMSYGDNVYEYNALMSLIKYLNEYQCTYLLKNVKFMLKPSLCDIIVELNNLHINIVKIIHIIDHIDIIFVK